MKVGHLFFVLPVLILSLSLTPGCGPVGDEKVIEAAAPATPEEEKSYEEEPMEIVSEVSQS